MALLTQINGCAKQSGIPLTTDERVSTLFATVVMEEKNTVTAAGSDGDLWPSCWSDDDLLYAANGDGRGFDTMDINDVAVNVLYGTPETGLTGHTLAVSDQIGPIWTSDEFNRKPTGMVSVGGVLYLAVQDLRRMGAGIFGEVPAASIYRSDDKGLTWTGPDEPMFPDYLFTTIFFLDYGKDSEHSDGYVYAYGLDYNWRGSPLEHIPDPVELFLGRVPETAVQDRSQWVFYAGRNEAGESLWSAELADRRTVMADPLTAVPWPKTNGKPVLSQGSVVYNAPLKRYLYSAWTGTSFDLYESERPEGPFRLFYSKPFGAGPWSKDNYGGYATTIPSKFISPDGKTFWIVSSTFSDGVWDYSFSLRKVTVTLYDGAAASNRPGPQNLALEPGAAIDNTANKRGFPERLRDGATDLDETSFTNRTKELDYWGYTFDKAYRFNALTFTTGQINKKGGGWLESLGVQVRRGFEWVDVTGLVRPEDFPYDNTVPEFTSYTLRFDTIEGDGIRLTGKPGGTHTYSALSELAVYCLP